MPSETLGRGQDAKITYGKQTLAAATATKVPASAMISRTSILILNVDTQPMYVGGDTSVTATTGFKLAANASIELEVSENAPVYVYSTAGGDVDYIEVRS